MENILDLIIVGAGPAGVTAAIYAKRSNINFKIFEKEMVGGNVVNAFEIENYPGVGKLMGSDLAIKFIGDLDTLGIDVNYEAITKIEKNDDMFKVTTSENEIYYTKKVLLALGTKARKLGISNEDQLLGRGISYCATCDGSFYKGKDVLVVGGGNSALTEALYLSKIVNKIYLITRHELKGDKKEIQKIKETSNIEVIEFKTVKEVEGNNFVTGVKIIDTNTNEESSLKVDGIFVYIGQLPPTNLVSDFGVLNKNGFIEVDEHYETKVKGLFAVGDCINKVVRQIVTATGDAATAIHFIEE